MLLTAPLFIVTTFKVNPDGNAVGLEMIAEFEVGSNGFNYAFENYIEQQAVHWNKLMLINAKGV